MSDTTAKPAQLSDRERALQWHLRCTTVPFKDGGGVVFPAGLLGIGYRLDAGQFEACRAMMEEMDLDDRARHITRAVNAVLVFTGCVFLAGAVVVGLMLFAPGLGSRLTDVLLDSPWSPPLVVAAALAILLPTIFYPLLQRTARFRRAFADAPHSSRFGHLRRRLLAIPVGGALGPQAYLGIAALFALLGCARLLLEAVSYSPSLGGAFQGFCSLLLAAAVGAPYWAHRSFRGKHGRAATPGDFGPL